MPQRHGPDERPTRETAADRGVTMAQPSTEHWLTPQRNTGSHPAQYARYTSAGCARHAATKLIGLDIGLLVHHTKRYVHARDLVGGAFKVPELVIEEYMGPKHTQYFCFFNSAQKKRVIDAHSP